MLDKKEIIFKGVGSSIGSKSFGFVYQIITLPMLISYLGVESFGLLSTYSTLVGWIALFGGGISPYITRVIANQSNFTKVTKVIDVSRTILFISSILFSILFLIISNYVSIFNKDILSAILILFLSLGIVNFSVSDSVRQGNHQVHINNMFQMVSQVTSILLLYIFIKSEFVIVNKLFTIVVATYTPLLMSKMINFLCLRKIYFKGGLFVFRKNYGRYFRVVRVFILANITIQISVIIVKSIAVVLLSKTNIVYVSQIEIVFRYLTIAGTFFATLQTIIWPLITHAEKSSELSWLKKIKYLLGVGFLLLALINMLIIYFYGIELFKLWLGENLVLERFHLIIASIYFLVIALAQAPIIILMGKGRFKFIGNTLLMESLLYTIGTVWIYFYNEGIDLVAAIIPMIVLRFLVFLRLAKASYG